MTPGELQTLERIAIALERIADRAAAVTVWLPPMVAAIIAALVGILLAVTGIGR